MTKEQFISLYDNRNAEEIIYQYYTEKFDKEKHNPFLSKTEVVHFMYMFNCIEQFFNVAQSYYKNKLNILTITTTDGKSYLK